MIRNFASIKVWRTVGAQRTSDAQILYRNVLDSFCIVR
jgi:hypothetical protein